MKKFFEKMANGAKKFFNNTKKAIKKFFELLKNKWLVKVTTTALVVAIVIVGYILLNWGAEKIKVEDLDFSAQKMYSLSNDTKERIRKLESEITIQLINMKDYVYTNNSGYILVEGNRVIEYINKYQVITDKIKVEEINDLETRIDLQNKYGMTTKDAIIVIKKGEKEVILPIYNLITPDYALGRYIDTMEEAITNAIIEVTIEDKPTIYVYNGKTYFDAQSSVYLMATALINEANEMKLLDILATGNIPEDCDCLIMTTLSQDLTELERDEILKYINRGGEILLLTSQGAITGDTPNFDKILAEYGITLDLGVVFEQDINKRWQDAPNYVVADASASFMDKINKKLQMFLINPGKIQFAEGEKLEELGVTYETIASTSNKSFVRTNFEQAEKTRTDKDSAEGSFIVGAYATKKISEEKSSKLIIYSDEIFASTQSPEILGIKAYAFYLYNNEDIVLNSISHLVEREDAIKIRNTYENQAFSVTEQEDAMVKTIIFVIPVLTIGAGIVVWLVRRRQY